MVGKIDGLSGTLTDIAVDGLAAKAVVGLFVPKPSLGASAPRASRGGRSYAQYGRCPFQGRQIQGRRRPR